MSAMTRSAGPRPGRLPLSKLRFGNIDARSEILTRDISIVEHFKESFLEPSGMSTEEFRKGQRFYVYGAKGAGKTAFLRYIQLEAEGNGCLTRFVTFASDISDEQRKRLQSLANIDLVEQDASPGQSAIDAWMMFIFREIALIIEKYKTFFTADRDIKYFCELVRTFFDGEKQGFLSWVFETAKRGKYKVKAKFLEANLSGQAGEKEKEIPLDVLIKQCLKQLGSLSWEGPNSVYLFFDELNLSFGSREQHKRDAILIRDLILAINRVNEFFIEENKPVYIMAAARSEVLHAVSVPTHEINKVLSDRGRELRWFSQMASEEAPIVRLFNKKVNTSEKLAKHPVSTDVMRAYFRRNTFGMDPKSLIVELTWCNPRDLILLFGPATTTENSGFFDDTVIAKYLEKYSRDAWNEKIEEMNVEYAPAELQALKKVFLSFKEYFRVIDYDMHIERRAKIDQNIANFSSRRSSVKVLEDLYRVGVLGQSHRRPLTTGTSNKQFQEHWVYRGDNNFDPSAWMVIHKALWPHLRLKDIWKDRDH